VLESASRWCEREGMSTLESSVDCRIDLCTRCGGFTSTSKIATPFCHASRRHAQR
jgi:hypothetical protein